MAIHWDIFRGGETTPSNGRLSASLNAKHVLTLNRYTRELLGKTEAVLVMFDKRESIIGLSPTHAADPDGFQVKPKGGGQNFVVHLAPFCRHHNIVIETTERFAQPGLTKEGYITLDLNKTINVSHRRRKRS
ncbi:MAG TPA: hypothetical protein VK612_01610 [Pyrinomonadaceae bacterium]|nr:hypothetical protein [Pyrinomonadaceae bacterium]